YSIGKWIDEDGDGKYDVLEVETRHLKHPRAYDASGAPLHFNAKSVVKERIYLDKADQNVLHDDITVYDDALLRPGSRTSVTIASCGRSSGSRRSARKAIPMCSWKARSTCAAPMAS